MLVLTGILTGTQCEKKKKTNYSLEREITWVLVNGDFPLFAEFPKNFILKRKKIKTLIFQSHSV